MNLEVSIVDRMQKCLWTLVGPIPCIRRGVNCMGTRKLSYRKDDRAMRMRPVYMGALKMFGSP